MLDEVLDEPDAKEAAAFEDDEEAHALLARHGFTKPGRAIHFNRREVPDAPTPPPLRDGFRYGTVEPEDLAEPVAIHRDMPCERRANIRPTTRVHARVTPLRQIPLVCGAFAA